MVGPNFVIGTFVTENSPYEQIFEEYLGKSLIKMKEAYGLDSIVVKEKHKGDWTKNVAEKPRVILDVLESMNKLNDDRLLLFLDADATIERYPYELEQVGKEYDIGLHYLDWRTWYNYQNSNVKELLTGTMFFRYNDRVKLLLKEWHAKAVQTQKWEQKVLESIMENHKKNLTLYEFSVEYCYIKTLPTGREPFVKCDPVILHHQVSRKMKKVMRRL
jgi:hypothetical protein